MKAFLYRIFIDSLLKGLRDEIIRLAGQPERVIVADYNCPMTKGISALIAYGIERMAAGDHYRNFLNYMSAGGLEHFTAAAGLTVISTSVRGNGVFVVAGCE